MKTTKPIAPAIGSLWTLNGDKHNRVFRVKYSAGHHVDYIDVKSKQEYINLTKAFLKNMRPKMPEEKR